MSYPPRFTNQSLAEFFINIANLLEIKGEIIYKTLAYRKAAEALAALPRDVNDLWREGDLLSIPGVGKAIAEKIDELLTTGRLTFFDKLTAEVPFSLTQLLEIPDVGPKKAALFWKELGVVDLLGLEAAVQAGKLGSLSGMGEKSAAKVAAGIAALKRRSGKIPLRRAYPLALELIAYLRQVPGVQNVAMAGSLRRMKATVGDLDLLAAASDTPAVINAFTSHPDVIAVSGQGDTKASVEFHNGLRAQLWAHPPERFGTALQYATGSKDHNVKLRELALKKGLSLSEHALAKEDGSEILCATEEEVYQGLGIPWIPPEMREDRGEVQAAVAGTLPMVIQQSDLIAELHSHTTWSDGKESIRDMAAACMHRGFTVLAVTDHSGSLGVAGGLSAEDLKRQRIELDAVQRELGDGFLLLQGAEVEILADGTLDYPDEVLESLDIVIASLHFSLHQPREKVMGRILNAIHNPHIDIIGHPTGRLIPDREGADLDMEAVLQAAAEHKTALEINANPARLDLEDIYCRRAIELGIPLAINTDAHSGIELDLVSFGVATARRGWVEARHVLNTWEPSRLVQWLKR